MSPTLSIKFCCKRQISVRKKSFCWSQPLCLTGDPKGRIKLNRNVEMCRYCVGRIYSIQSLDRLGHQGDVRDDSAEILFQSHLQEALVSSSGMDRDVHFLMLSTQHFFCWPQHHPPSKVSWKMVLEMLLWHVKCLNHASFCPLTVARRGWCGPTRVLILLRTQSLFLRCKLEMWKSFLRHKHLVSKAWFLLSGSASRVQLSQPQRRTEVTRDL